MTLPRCLALLATSKRAEPAKLPLICFTPAGRQTLAVLPCSEVCLQDPIELAELAQARGQRGAALLLASLPDDAREEASQLLARYGVSDLWSAWTTETSSWATDVGGQFAAEIDRLRSRLDALWLVLPRLAASFGPRLSWTFAERRIEGIEVAEGLVVRGQFCGVEAEINPVAMPLPDRTAGMRLLLTPDALGDPLEIAYVHRFIEELGHGEPRTPFAATLEIRDFIRARYRYDPTYLENPQISHWLSKITRGAANAHIAALHAARDTSHLGGGVCYELNMLACELLRRHGIPAAVATGWVFDRGSIAEPDHLWAMALLPTRAGPRWFPIDAATTLDGRSLRVERAAVPWRATPPPRPKKKAAKLPRWAQLEAKRQRSLRKTNKARSRRRRAVPSADLLRILRYLEKRHHLRGADGSISRQRCEQLLADPESAEQLLQLLARITPSERDE